MLGKHLVGLAECGRCERLVKCRTSVAPKKGYGHRDYWNAPVAGFGDAEARVCLVGLAPGAHGANRTGRPFTGDGAGDFMYPLLHEAGFSNQPQVSSAEDGLALKGLYITNAVKCLPPENKPTTEEFASCAPFLSEELESLSHLQVVLFLGQGAFTSYLRQLRRRGAISRLADYSFGHGASYRPEKDGPWLVASYHTSRYNIQTGRMTAEMFLGLLHQVRRLAGLENG